MKNLGIASQWYNFPLATTNNNPQRSTAFTLNNHLIYRKGYENERDFISIDVRINNV